MHTPRLRRPSRTVLVAVVLVAIVGVASILFLVRSGVTREQVTTLDATITVPEQPGSPDVVELDSRLYLPETTPAPAVLLAHGFGGDKFSVASQARSLAQDGFVVLTYSARGFGTSTGTISLNDPDREVADGRALVDWLADRPEVVLDGPDDPRVGVAGGSYGGALALSVAGTDPRIDAVAASITWNDLGQALFPNYGVTSEDGREQLAGVDTPAGTVYGGPGVLKRGWAGVFFGAGSAGADSPTTPAGGEQSSSSLASGCGRFAPEFCAAYAQSAVSGEPTPALLDLLTAHSPTAVAANITAPTLLVQGVQDTLFGLDQADATARQISDAGGTVEVRWFGGGHDAGGTDDNSDSATSAFLAAELRPGSAPSDDSAAEGTSDDSAAALPFTYAVQGSAGDRERAGNRTVTASDYPGLASTTSGAGDSGEGDGGEGDGERESTRTIPVELSPAAASGPSASGPGGAADPGAQQTIIRPPGASPSAISSVPGLGSILSTLSATSAGNQLSADIPGQSASFVGETLDQPLAITGSSRVNLSVGAFSAPGQAVLFVKLYDVAPDGGRTLPGGGVAALRLPDSVNDGPVPVTVTLPGISYSIPQGHHVEISVSTTDQAYAMPLEPAQFVVSLDEPVLTVPSVEGVSTRASTVPAAPLIGIAILTGAVAVLIAVTAIRSRRRIVAEVDEDLLETPLVITDLAKTYSNGFKAVDGVGFTVQKGQVLGLLGPNGAGKTTTLRMLMGLITPTSGDIRVFGHTVSPGAPVLSRLGSFVEGSGFLPHLSGRENLRLYWQATGRPAEDAHLEEALDIADLGAAIERKVKSYSQGMRQRLAIAQAMLGLPDLMVLDEPTNGLDPPQIRTMRDVLIDYAKTGRTVLVSSHLLAEVEQTCTHVVVMNRGSVISSGTVRELTEAGGRTELRVDDADRADTVLTDLGLSAEIVDEHTLRVELGSVDPGDVTRALFDAGLQVRGLSQSTRLEDVFLELVHNDALPPSSTGPAPTGETATSRTELVPTKDDR